MLLFYTPLRKHQKKRFFGDFSRYKMGTLARNGLMICNPSGNYMLKVTNKNTRTKCEICSKLKIKKVLVF